MDVDSTPELSALLTADGPESRERAWAAFLASHSDLLLRAAQRFGGGYDARMDRYQHVIDGLRRNDFERLHAYHSRSRSTFRNWLVVVARRLCVDFERSRYGRGGRAADAEMAGHERNIRRRLVDLLGSEIDLSRLAAPSSGDPERRLQEKELRSALHVALEALPPRDALLLALRFEDQASAREIARMMDFSSEFHVYRRLRSVLAELRKELLSRGFVDPSP